MVGIRDVFPPKPSFTEQNLGSQAGKVEDYNLFPLKKY
jgi:hypothetical protein